MSIKTKLSAIWAIIRKEHFVLITQTKFISITPRKTEWGDTMVKLAKTYENLAQKGKQDNDKTDA